jgi:hypothetical protein
LEKHAMRFVAFIISILAAASIASAATYPVPGGVAIQVNEGDTLAPASVFATFLNRQDDVHDAAGWHRSEKALGTYTLPATDAASYQQAAANNWSNVLTLQGCVKFAPYNCPRNSSFPQTPAQITGFANWACWLVKNNGGPIGSSAAANIPALRAVTIWSEMNGSFNGGITQPPSQQQAMANLLNVVVPAIRSCNSGIKIYVGAFVGSSNLATWFCHIQTGTTGSGFPLNTADGLDIHPYLNANPAMPNQNGTAWQQQIAGKYSLTDGCQGKTTPILMPLYFSEWGGAALASYLNNNPTNTAADYFSWFEATIGSFDQSRHPIAGRAYFLLDDFNGKFPNEFLAGAGPDYVTTPIGEDYITAYKQ